MRASIVYIGNQLAGNGRTATTIDTLGQLLKKEGYQITQASSKKNKFLRLCHMIQTVYRNRKWADYVLVDTYSTTNFWYAVIVGRLCEIYNLKYIPVLHGGNLPLRLQRQPMIMKRFLDNAYKVVCPSEYLNHAFAKANYSNFIIIPNSIELIKYHFKSRSKYSTQFFMGTIVCRYL